MLADSLGTWVLAPQELSRAWFTGRNRAGNKDDVKGQGAYGQRQELYGWTGAHSCYSPGLQCASGRAWGRRSSCHQGNRRAVASGVCASPLPSP